jgi:serpin B
VDVNEIGTEAAAATGVVMGLKSMPTGEPIEVKIDRPFLFVIRDVQTGAMLFFGRVVQP